MRACDIECCKRWLVDRGGALGLNDAPLLPAGTDRVQFSIPTDSGTQTILASRLVEWCHCDGALIWMTVWGEHLPGEMATFLKARERHGVQASLGNVPGSVLEQGDGSALEEMVRLMMAFNWEAIVFEEQLFGTIWLADEVVEVATSDRQRKAELLRVLKDLHIQTFE
jgi:hypothetical protein